ncbi:hypothetical protein [Amedibacillus sp. YH-ame10]
MKEIKKKVGKVLLSSTMTLTMAFSIVPTNILAQESDHCSHWREDGTYDCSSKDENGYICNHDDNCGYIKDERNMIESETNVNADSEIKKEKEITRSISTPQVKSISKRTSLLDLQDKSWILDKDGNQITSSDGVFDAMDSEGWMFDSNTQTLTLNGANFDTNTNPSIIMPRILGAKVVLKGINNISNSNTNAIDMANYPLTIEGDGTLIANTKEVCIATYDGLIINGGTFDLTSLNSDAIYSPLGDVIISNGKLELSAVKANGIFTSKNIVLSGGIVNANSYYCGMQARGVDGIKIDNSTVVVNSTADYGIWVDASLAINDNSDVTATGAIASLGARTSITIEPTINKSVDVYVGDKESSAKLLAGAPFSTKTDLKALGVTGNLYFHSKIHAHTASTTWSTDVTSHWHECTTKDGGKLDLSTHTPSAPATFENAQVCTVCGFEIAPKLEKTNIVDKTTGTEIEYEDGSVFADDITLVVTPKSKEDMKNLQNNVNKVVTGKTVAGVYDIKLLKNGVEIQPNGKLKISLSLTEEMKAMSELQVVYFDDNGKVTIIPSQLIDGKLVFITDHFSYYGVIGKENSTGQIQPETPSKPTSPQTGDTTNTMLCLGLIVLSGSIIGYGVKKKKALRN